MPTITAEHLHALLASAHRDAALVVVAGRAAVVPDDPGRDGPEDALVVTTRSAVIAEFDTGANEEQLETLAQRLDVALESLGS